MEAPTTLLFQEQSHYCILDIRLAEDFALRHIRESTSIPCKELFFRLFELPDRDHTVCLLGCQDDLGTAQSLLLENGWKFIDTVIDNECVWEECSRLGLLETGTRSRRLWSPNVFLSSQTSEIERLLELHQQKKPFRALDVGCGMGRDAVYLASRSTWHVVALDNRRGILDRALSLAARNDCKISVHPLLIDLQKSLKRDSGSLAPVICGTACECDSPQDGASRCSPGKFDLVLVNRYLHRPLFPFLREWVKPHGFILCSHFLVGAEKFGHPKSPNDLVALGEFQDQFGPNHSFRVHAYKEGTLADGRPFVWILSQKVQETRPRSAEKRRAADPE
eukprot:TRINITY_DN5340_c0_g1::TRINITY_DN5340_c0_g1_i1::g.24232::m.24232 TRINITY_DN5340_c0_g1::TRINITY_DN5340_c0_g1_i1::g.24232  ORF type:complete len:335 (+),score=4.24,sp/O14074/YEA9_SCHPO/25.31/9e-20,Methyltransf_18/PF12847.2/8.2e+03,Methyltransf_18/PF12847.2/6.5e-08,TehB/PF03848.9/1.3e-05,Methyltransf_31/PF13847.1/0.003,Methyltransf_31/PF13847.1/4.6e+02,MTS/PF05175.9/0.0024,MTS/PF05175.9/7.1e+02,Methyltransf_23/PF13489.1/0.0011,Methyltransf_11/PF08241.7/0.003,Rhodanese/PF00581.15/0.0029,Methyltransf_